MTHPMLDVVIGMGNELADVAAANFVSMLWGCPIKDLPRPVVQHGVCELVLNILSISVARGWLEPADAFETLDILHTQLRAELLKELNNGSIEPGALNGIKIPAFR
jgi:hypothetical protein